MKTRSDKIILDINNAIKIYSENNQSLRKTAKILGVSEKTLQRRFTDENVLYKKRTYYSCNEEFFDDLNEKSLYWLGFLAADGNISIRRGNYCIRLGLARKDKTHIELFKTDICSDAPIHDYIQKSSGPTFKKSEYPYSTISISSKLICDKLAEYNIIPSKTHIFEFPKQLINHPGMRHFIRGCIDGDGSEGLRFNEKGNSNQVRISLSGNPKFVKQVYDIIKEKCNLSNHSGTMHVEKAWAKFEFAAHEDIKKIKAFLYDDTTIYLERKFANISRINYVIENSKLFIIDSQELQSKYNELGTFAAVAKEYNVCNETVKRRMNKLNLQYKDLSNYEHDNLFFEQENECEKQFYVAGYLATMSSIRRYSSNKSSITITNKNKDEIDMIKSMLNTESTIHEHKHYSISIFSHKIISDLIRFGITENKLHGFTIPEWILKHDMVNHFVRGCIEGKGSISNKSQLLLELTGSASYLRNLKDIFIAKCGLTTINEIRNRKDQDRYRLTYSGKSVAPIIQYLYHDATIFLPRKKEIIQHLL